MRRRANPETRRAEIIAAALEVFGERGYRGASLAAVAEKVGLTQQGLLHHFPSKDELLVEVLRFRDQVDGLEFGFETDALPQLEKLVAYNATRVGLVQSFTVLSAESVTDEHPARPYFTTRYREARERLTGYLRTEPLREGLTPEHAATLLIAVMDGLQLQWLLTPDEVDMPAAFGALIALLRRDSRRDDGGLTP